MNWNADRSITLSQVCVVLFALLLAALDIAAYWVVQWYLLLSRGLDGFPDEVFLLAVIYLCSVFAWILLWRLWKLLGSLKKGLVFTAENVSCLRAASWCCAAVFVICALSALHYVPFAAFSVAAGFMALIVRIIKNVFQQAVGMKSELDLTI